MMMIMPKKKEEMDEEGGKEVGRHGKKATHTKKFQSSY